MNKLPKGFQWCHHLLTGCLLLFILVGTCRAADDAANIDPEGKLLDQLATSGIPAAYGEVLAYLETKGGVQFTEAARQYIANKTPEGARALTGLATTSSTRTALSNVNQIFGRLFSGIDVATKLAGGDNAAAAEASAVWFVTELAGTEAGKKMLTSYGVTPPIVSAVLVSYAIWRESEKALASAVQGRKLESLFGGVENMTRSKGRTLGTGDPFPPTQENIDKVWRRVLTDPDFRDRFKIYVTELLMQEFPEPGYFDMLDVYVADPIISAASGQADPVQGYAVAALTGQSTASTASQRLERTSQLRLQEKKGEMQRWISSLIGGLNLNARIDEQRLVTYQQLKAIALRLQMNGSSVEQAMGRFEGALGQLGVVAAYLRTSPQDIKTAIEKDDYETLLVHMKMVTDYTKNVVAWLPSQGPLAEVRAELLAALKDRYKNASRGFSAFRTKLKLRIETPKLVDTIQSTSQTAPTTGQATPVTQPPAAIDPTGFYQQYLQSLIKPFDWGGTGEPEKIKAVYEQHLEKGEFTQATMLEKAWAQQNFSLAINDMVGTDIPPFPREEETFSGYERILRGKVATTKYPGEIVSLNQSLKTREEAISSLFLDGNCMVFPGAYNCGDRPRPKGETPEQIKARIDRGQAIMAQSREMSEGLQPERIQLSQLMAAWGKAHELANRVIADRVTMAQLRQDELATWMMSTRQIYEDNGRQATDALNAFRSSIATITLPLPTGASAGEEALRQLEELLAAKSYLGIGKLAAPGGRLLDAAEAAATGRSSQLLGEAKSLPYQTNRLLAEAYAAAEAFAQGVPIFAEAVTIVTPEIDDIVTYAAPDFREKLAALSLRSDRAKKLAEKLRTGADAAAGLLQQEIENREADGYWLRKMASNIGAFRRTALKWGVLDENSADRLQVAGAHGGITPNAILIYHPFIHYLTSSERDAVATELRGIWTEGKLAAFAAGPAPWFDAPVKSYLDQLARAPSFPEANFCVGESSGSHMERPVTTGNLAKAKQLRLAMVPGEESFENGFYSLASLVPMEIAFYGGRIGTFRDLYLGTWQQTPLGQEYLAFRNELKKDYASHLLLWAEKQRQAQELAARQAIGQMNGWLAVLQQRIANGDALISRSESLTGGNQSGIEAALKELNAFHDHLLDEPYSTIRNGVELIYSVSWAKEPVLQTAQGVLGNIGNLSSRLHLAKERLKNLQQQGPQADLTTFYESFRQAYELRNESAIMAMIGDSWEAGDGTTLADLEGYLRNSFTVFDQITYKLSQLTYSWNGRAFTVSYDLTITGRNFRYNLKHEEKSTVQEEVALDSRGKLRIIRTLNGRFWYVQ